MDGTDGGGQNIKNIRRLSWILSFMTPKRPAYPSLNDGFGEETRQSFWVIFRKNSALITFFYAFAHFSQYFLESFCWNVKDVHSHHVSFIYWTSPLFWKYDVPPPCIEFFMDCLFDSVHESAKLKIVPTSWKYWFSVILFTQVFSPNLKFDLMKKQNKIRFVLLARHSNISSNEC